MRIAGQPKCPQESVPCNEVVFFFGQSLRPSPQNLREKRIRTVDSGGIAQRRQRVSTQTPLEVDQAGDATVFLDKYVAEIDVTPNESPRRARRCGLAGANNALDFLHELRLKQPMTPN